MKKLSRFLLCMLHLILGSSGSYAQHFSASRNTTAQYFFDKDGRLYTWGAVQYLAADGVEHGEVPDPIEVKHPFQKNWKMGMNSATINFLLDEDGDLYKVAKNLAKFISFDGESKWADVSGADGSYGLVSKSGKLYFSGRLYSNTSNSPKTFIPLDTLVLMPNPPDGSFWAKVSVGAFHFSGLTTTGKIYSFGDNSFGQFGCGDTNVHQTPTEMPHPIVEFDIKWTKIVVWDRASIALDEHGNLFYSGAFNYFPKASAGAVHTLQFINKQKGEKWVDVQISHFGQVLGLTENGSLYAWGVLKKDGDHLALSLPKIVISLHQRKYLLQTVLQNGLL